MVRHRDPLAPLEFTKVLRLLGLAFIVYLCVKCSGCSFHVEDPRCYVKVSNMKEAITCEVKV